MKKIAGSLTLLLLYLNLTLAAVNKTADGRFMPVHLNLTTEPTGAALCVVNVDDYCPVLEGTLSANSVCKGTSPSLIFTTTMGTAPYTLTYTDGVNTFTQANVQSGTPFVVPSVPATNTVYTLTSIQDASTCAPTVVSNSAQVTIQNCTASLCTGSLGDPVVNITFGKGDNPGPSLPTAVPGATTSLTYVPVSGNPATPVPIDGQYTITNNIPANGAWFVGASNHTPGDANGYMAFYNATEQPGEFYTQTVSNLCESTTYEFAAWIANALNPAVLIGVNPNITFRIEQTDGTLLASYNTGDIPQSGTFTWKQFGLSFTTPPNISTIVLRLINNNPGGAAQPGNDLAIDDITFRPCGPTSTASFSMAAFTDSMSACEGTRANLYGSLSSGYPSPGYLWQLSSDSGKTWTDIVNSNSLQISVAPPVTGRSVNYKYRMLVANGNNINSPNCRVTSNLINFTSLTGPPTDFVFDQSICNPLQVTFSGPTGTGYTYSWNIAGVDYPAESTLTRVFSQDGIYTVKLKISDAMGCADSILSSIPIQVQKKKIINTKDSTICAGHSMLFSAISSLAYCWTPAGSLDNPSIATPTASPTTATTYYLVSKTVGANLIVNSDFSSGNTGFTSAYTYDPVNKDEGEYFVGTTPHNWNIGAPVGCGDHTTGTGNMLMINGDPTLGVEVWKTQSIAVSPNTNYAFSIWIQSISPISPSILQFSINGKALGAPINASATACSWSQFYTTWNSGNNTTATISLINENIIRYGNDFALDDISFAPVTLLQDSVVIGLDDAAVNAFPDTSICPGSTAKLNAVGSLSTSPFTYKWSPSAGLSDSTLANPIASPKATTGYTVTAQTSHGCTATASLLVSLFPPATISLTPDTTICPGVPVQLQASGGGLYSWTPAQLLDNPNSNQPFTSLLDTTLFRVTVTDGNQCSSKDSVLVKVRPAVVFKAPPNQQVCQGTGIPLTSDNSKDYLYNWSPAEGLSDPTAPAPVATPTATISYALAVSDPVCGHDSNFALTVTVIPRPDVKAQKANDIDCAVTASQLNATGAQEYLWTPEEGLDNPHIPSPVATIDSTTTFIVQGTDKNGCSAFDTLTVKVTATGPNRFIVPSAFSPNGDGRNDCFGIKRWGDVKVEEFSVYNRWGGRVFTTRNPADCWDGTFNGNPQPSGGYVYVIKAWSFCGEITRKGVVTLVR